MQGLGPRFPTRTDLDYKSRVRKDSTDRRPHPDTGIARGSDPQHPQRLTEPRLFLL